MALKMRFIMNAINVYSNVKTVLMKHFIKGVKFI